MDNAMQMYAKNRKPYALNHEDDEHKIQTWALFSFLVIGSRLRSSITASCMAFWLGIWTQDNVHWTKPETAGSTPLVANTIFAAWNPSKPLSMGFLLNIQEIPVETGAL